MTYVEGFVIPLAKKNVKAYAKMALWGRKMWMKHGALQYFECVGDDFKSSMGCGSFKTLAKLKPNETVFFSFIVYKSKAHCNAVNKRVMAEMKKQNLPMPEMLFDLNRTAMAGFKTLVQGQPMDSAGTMKMRKNETALLTLARLRTNLEKHFPKARPFQRPGFDTLRFK